MSTDKQPDIDESKLPSEYDELVSVEKLVHGQHNPRQVRPKDNLRRSIETSGINRPLIVRPDDEDEVLHVTDGWQRYQAATECGWEVLPVKIYETPLEALVATEVESIVREMSTYEWAVYCESFAAELDGNSTGELAEKVADRTGKSLRTVRRYLDVLSLPREVHLLLNDGPTGTEQEWMALKNHNPDVRRYDGLRWTVAAKLAEKQSELDRDRVVGIAVTAVTFDDSNDAKEFIELAADEQDRPLETVRKQVVFGQTHRRYLQIPEVAVPMEEEKKEAVMDYCRARRKPLSAVVKEAVERFAEEKLDDKE
jgi:ParB/RepB/Spo0J family partition protein